jgi:hypothetical protein
MCDNSRECQAARRHGFATKPRYRVEAPGSASVRPPGSALDRLGISSGMRVALVGTCDEDVVRLVREATTNVTSMLPREPVDVLVYQADGVFALRRLAELMSCIQRDGTLWILWPRGDSGIGQSHVRHAGLDAGMVDVMVASISERLSGLKFVYRLRDR